MPPIAILVEFDPHPEHAQTFLRRLEADAAETLMDDGCLRMEVLHAVDGSGHILLSELWRDRAAIEAHRSKPGHTHDWQHALLKAKKVTVWDAVDPQTGRRTTGGNDA